MKPGYATEAQWKLISSNAVAPDVSADAVVAIIKTLVKYSKLHGDDLVMAKQESIIGRRSLVWWGSFALLLVLLVAFFLVYGDDQGFIADSDGKDGVTQLTSTPGAPCGMPKLALWLLLGSAAACASLSLVLRA